MSVDWKQFSKLGAMNKKAFGDSAYDSRDQCSHERVCNQLRKIELG
ncbi:MAG: hypothetical protein QXY52_05490 [Conexivisphaerales archaeon]